MYYTVQARKNPIDKKADPLYYAVSRTIGNVGIEQISEEIALATSLTRGDVDNVIKSFLDTIPKYLKMGYNVNLGELCNVRLSLSSKGSESPEDVSHNSVRHIKAVFTATAKLRRELIGTSVHPYPDL